MYKLFFEHMNKEFDFLKKSKLLLCVSGGVDSIVLADLLKKMNYNISIAHCNFKLRKKESDLDEDFVKAYALENSFAFFSKSFVTKLPKHSLQMAARTLRYNWFKDILSKENLDYIITAHHLDDSLETFILNISRASGIEGLTGIKALNNVIARPLLVFSKDQILSYAKENNIKWREDLTNNKNDYQRNQLRNEVIPYLKKIHPDFLDQSRKTMKFLKKSNIIINEYVKLIKKNNFIIKKEEILISKYFLKENQHMIFELFKDYSFKSSKQIIELCYSISGKVIKSKDYTLLSNRSNLILKKNKIESENVYKVGKNGLKSPIKINICIGKYETKFNSKSLYISEKDIEFPLFLRKWKKGDVIFPVGMKGKKLVSKYYKDQKMSFFDKQNQWLLCNNNEVIWIVGIRADRRYFKSINASIKIELL